MGREDDHEVEPETEQEVQVRHRVQAAVDVGATVDHLGTVVTRDRAGGGHRLGHVRFRRTLAAEHDAVPGLVVAGDDPGVGVLDPTAVRGYPANGVLDRVGRDEAGRREAGERFEDRRGAGAQAGQGQREGAG